MSKRIEWSMDLDKEWIQLIIEAKKLGMDQSTIREFLHSNKITELLIEK